MAAQKRKHNSAAQRAHQKNLEDARYREKVAKRKAFMKKYRKQLTIGITAAVVLIVGIWLICKATIGPNGSIPNFFGTLQGVGENWIVTTQGSASQSRYYKMGEFSGPDGYTLDPDYVISSDDKAQSFYYTADDENAVIQTVYVSGVKNKTSKDMLDSVVAGIYAEGATTSDTPVGGQDASWVIGLVNDDENATEDSTLEIGHKQMTAYFDSVQNACVVMILSSKEATPVSEIPSDEEFLAAAEKIAANLKIEH